MRVIPAVDIRGGVCVNLVQGDFDQETVFSRDPVAQALKWHSLGADIVHIVDLDGAREGRLFVTPELRLLHQQGVAFEIGGGIRQMSDIEEAFALGADRVILGTSAYRNPNLVKEAARRFPNRIVVGIDAKAGKVSLSGWREDTDTDAVEFALRVQDAGASRVIYTDILRDGMLQGPNFRATQALADALRIPVTISGGVSTLEDIRQARRLEVSSTKTSGVIDEIIVGRALYVGAFTLEEALKAATAR